MKKRVLCLTLAVLVILTALMALVSCGTDEPDVDFYVELIGSNYDSSTDTTHVNLKVRVDNYTDGRDLSAYKFKLSFYSSSNRLLNTEDQSTAMLGGAESLFHLLYLIAHKECRADRGKRTAHQKLLEVLHHKFPHTLNKL